LYFSRSPIPHHDFSLSLHHHGIYAYRAGVLRRLVAAPASKLELSERLEQLRALSLGMKIRVAVPSTRPGVGVDTEEDLQAVATQI
jgi:3-deoxy-manno-octulosonate cytidylyltransferase (CMP-KDO synthetase)